MSKTFHITTFGCQMNEHDSEIMAGLLIEKGLKRVDDVRDADIEILNTCSVRENADKRFFGTLGQLKNRHENGDFLVCVCGCMMQQQPVIDTLKAKYPWVDIVFGTHNLHTLPILLDKVSAEKSKIIDIWPDTDVIAEDLPAERLFKHKALVNIMFGCNNFCTYCIVPYTRGREKSRAPEAIIKEVEALVADGVKEIMLLGQNVNSYKGYSENTDNNSNINNNSNSNSNSYYSDANSDELDDSGVESTMHSGKYTSFAELIYKLNDIEGLERIRFMTSHPKDLSDELIQAFADCDKLCKNIHLPVQAGSDRVLKRMNRVYNREHYFGLIKKLRSAVPEITISTDIIVGFPGETEEDFEETLSLVNEVEYDSAFTFLYSVRQGTPAEKYEDQIPEEIKHERFNRLVDAVNTISERKNSEYMGRIEKVLVEGPSRNNPFALSGRTDGFKLVNFSVEGTSFETCMDKLVGRTIDIEITGTKTFSLEGRIVE